MIVLRWLQENPNLALWGLIILSLLATVLGVRGLWRSSRRMREKPRPWLAFSGNLTFTLVAGGLLAFAVYAATFFVPVLSRLGSLTGHEAPPLEYALVADAGQGALTEHRGQVVLVNLWATWCPPCRAELPDLDRLQQEYRDQGLVVLLISDEQQDKVRSFLADNPMEVVHGTVDQFPWIADPGRPTSFFVDREGRIRGYLIGQGSYEQFEQRIGELL